MDGANRLHQHPQYAGQLYIRPSDSGDGTFVADLAVQDAYGALTWQEAVDDDSMAVAAAIKGFDSAEHYLLKRAGKHGYELITGQYVPSQFLQLVANRTAQLATLLSENQNVVRGPHLDAYLTHCFQHALMHVADAVERPLPSAIPKLMQLGISYPHTVEGFDLARQVEVQQLTKLAEQSAFFDNPLRVTQLQDGSRSDQLYGDLVGGFVMNGLSNFVRKLTSLSHEPIEYLVHKLQDPRHVDGRLGFPMLGFPVKTDLAVVRELIDELALGVAGPQDHYRLVADDEADDHLFQCSVLWHSKNYAVHPPVEADGVYANSRIYNDEAVSQLIADKSIGAGAYIEYDGREVGSFVSPDIAFDPAAPDITQIQYWLHLEKVDGLPVTFDDCAQFAQKFDLDIEPLPVPRAAMSMG